MFERSLCPAIFGHEMVKAGLVLGLFGGSQKHTDSLVCGGSRVESVGVEVYVCVGCVGV